ncbi:MAG: Transglutaminase protein [candidate division Zixibacteria bacterium RBG-1]|nr:MAG: Transglutaminase protein [candidate division Zixibacteria bacterium RBG-1]
MSKLSHKKVLVKLFSAGIIFTALGILIASWSRSKSVSETNAKTRNFQLTYSVKVEQIPKDTKELLLFLPVPESDRYQEISDVKIKSAYTYSVYKEPEYGNSILKIQLSKEVPSVLELNLDLSVKRKAYSLKENHTTKEGKISENNLKRFLLPDRLVPIDGKIALEAQKVIQKEMTEMQKAKVIYDYIVGTVEYDKSGTGWGRGDALYACDVRKGNCTDFHSLFIGMARASGIPTRFVMGFPLPEAQTQGELPGYHCWAEFYVDEFGWIPVDASEAQKHPEKKEFFFGGLDENRVAFTIGRDIKIDPKGNSVDLNYFIYPYVIIDGKEHTTVETKVKFANLEKKII